MLHNHQIKVLFSRVEDFYSCDPPGATLRAFPTFVSSPRGVRPRPLRANRVWSLESCEQNQLRANQDFFLPCKNANANMAFLASESLDRATRFRVGVVCYASRMGSVLLRKKYLISVLHLFSVIYSPTDRLAAPQNVRLLPASRPRPFLITEEAFRFHGYGAAQQTLGASGIP